MEDIVLSAKPQSPLGPGNKKINMNIARISGNIMRWGFSYERRQNRFVDGLGVKDAEKFVVTAHSSRFLLSVF
jgi:hypothetical protein